VKGVTNQSRPSDVRGKIQAPSLPLNHKAESVQKLQKEGQGKRGSTFKPQPFIKETFDVRKNLQTLMIWSFEAVSTQLPFWFHLTQRTVFLWPWLQNPCGTCQFFYKNPKPNLSLITKKICTHNEQSSLPDLASQSFTRLSFPPKKKSISSINHNNANLIKRSWGSKKKYMADLRPEEIL